MAFVKNSGKYHVAKHPEADVTGAQVEVLHDVAKNFSLDVTKAANQAASTAATISAVKADLNTLLAALKTAGLMVAD